MEHATANTLTSGKYRRKKRSYTATGGQSYRLQRHEQRRHSHVRKQMLAALTGQHEIARRGGRRRTPIAAKQEARTTQSYDLAAAPFSGLFPLPFHIRARLHERNLRQPPVTKRQYPPATLPPPSPTISDGVPAFKLFSQGRQTSRRRHHTINVLHDVSGKHDSYSCVAQSRAGVFYSSSNTSVLKLQELVQAEDRTRSTETRT